MLLIEEDVEVLRSVLPIVNRAECHGCHGSAKKLNGMLILDISLAPIQAQLRGEVRRMGIATAILTVVLLGGVGMLVRRLALSRLMRLGKTARSITGGALGERPDADLYIAGQIGKRGETVVVSSWLPWLERMVADTREAKAGRACEVRRADLLRPQGIGFAHVNMCLRANPYQNHR